VAEAREPRPLAGLLDRQLHPWRRSAAFRAPVNRKGHDPPARVLRQARNRLAVDNRHRARSSQACWGRWLVRLRKWTISLREGESIAHIFLYSLCDNIAYGSRGVAVGSSIGHAIGGWFGGGQANVGAQEQADNALDQQQQSMQQPNQQGYARCELVARDLTKCLDENSGSQHQMSICSYYLDQLRACQAAASQY
jgi:hypothetical protein